MIGGVNTAKMDWTDRYLWRFAWDERTPPRVATASLELLHHYLMKATVS